MKTYGTDEEITVKRKWYVSNLTTGAQNEYDLYGAGYTTANAPLSDLTKGKVTFSMTDAYGNVPTILVGGNPVRATGIMLMNPAPSTDHFSSYFQWNTSVTPPGYYFCKTTFEKTGGQNAVTYSWTILIQ